MHRMMRTREGVKALTIVQERALTKEAHTALMRRRTGLVWVPLGALLAWLVVGCLIVTWFG